MNYVWPKGLTVSLMAQKGRYYICNAQYNCIFIHIIIKSLTYCQSNIMVIDVFLVILSQDTFMETVKIYVEICEIPYVNNI